MKKFKQLMSEDKESINEAISMSKLKRLNLVGGDDWSEFVRAIKKMDADKPMTLPEKNMISKVFNELVNTIVDDSAMFQKVVKANRDKE
jgi:hypothetical protein